MEKERKNKKIILVVLLITIIGLSIGFAAFASTLTMQTSATVTPNPDSFKVVFSSSNTEVAEGTPILDGTYATGGTFEKNATTITGLKANFTAPGQTATWKVYTFNDGEYDAFLNNVTLGEITCTAKNGTSQSSAIEASQGISVKVTVGGTEYSTSNTDISSHKLAMGTGEEVLITLTYAEGSARADGDFDITIGDITLIYNSVD